MSIVRLPFVERDLGMGPMHQAYEDNVRADEAAACSTSPVAYNPIVSLSPTCQMLIQREREILDRCFASVKFELTDLDGLTWTPAAKRQNTDSDTYLACFPRSPSNLALTASVQDYSFAPPTHWNGSHISQDTMRSSRSCSDMNAPGFIGPSEGSDPQARGSGPNRSESTSDVILLDSNASSAREQQRPKASRIALPPSTRQQLRRTVSSRCPHS